MESERISNEILSFKFVPTPYFRFFFFFSVPAVESNKYLQ